ncbi:MAG: SIMPL domain-containing protein, partial [Bacteroidota bacterium]
MSNIDQKGVDYMRIDKKTHSQIEEYRKEIKKNALLAAKEKAAYLLEVLECEIGEVVSIKEINNDLEYNNYWWNPGYYSSNVSYQEQSPGTNEELEISLRYEVEAEFKIK